MIKWTRGILLFNLLEYMFLFVPIVLCVYFFLTKKTFDCGSFEDGFFELQDFHNTTYHLNEKGRGIRSNYFIKKIKAVITSGNSKIN